MHSDNRSNIGVHLSTQFSDNMITFHQFCESLSPSEAVYGFASWLTIRDDALKIGAKEDASQVADLVKEFVEKQELEKPRESWTDDLVPMKNKNGEENERNEEK